MLEVSLCGMTLKNPVMNAAGTLGYVADAAESMDISKLGAAITKTITLHPLPGNPPPRIVECSSGILNSIGLENMGLDCFVRDMIPRLREHDVPVVASIAGRTTTEFGQLARKLSDLEEIHALEINVSCPNVKLGGRVFGIDSTQTSSVVQSVRRNTDIPIITKLSPNVTDIVQMAEAAIDSGTDAISLVNTVTGMAIDIHSRKPIFPGITGGLSGPAIKPVALRMVWECYDGICRDSGIPIIGMGGIVTAHDAIEFMLAGATCIAVGTASFFRPTNLLEIVRGIGSYVRKHGMRSVGDLVGEIII